MGDDVMELTYKATLSSRNIREHRAKSIWPTDQLAKSKIGCKVYIWCHDGDGNIMQMYHHIVTVWPDGTAAVAITNIADERGGGSASATSLWGQLNHRNAIEIDNWGNCDLFDLLSGRYFDVGMMAHKLELETIYSKLFPVDLLGDIFYYATLRHERVLWAEDYLLKSPFRANYIQHLAEMGIINKKEEILLNLK